MNQRPDDDDFQLPDANYIPEDVPPEWAGGEGILVGSPEPEPEALPEPEPDPDVEEFTPEERATFSSLMTVGAALKNHSVLGHDVLLATPNVDDELRVALFTKEYRDTDGFSRAFQVAIVAASIREVNGEPFYSSLVAVPDDNEVYAAKVAKLRKFHPLSISIMYQKVIEMEQEYAQMAQKLGKL